MREPQEVKVDDSIPISVNFETKYSIVTSDRNIWCTDATLTTAFSLDSAMQNLIQIHLQPTIKKINSPS